MTENRKIGSKTFSRLPCLPQAVRIDLAAAANVLGERGPALGRPYVDTLNGSKHANMKELRFKSNGGVWRVAFAFDPKRNAVVLIAIADVRYDEHLSDLKGAKP